MERTILFFDVDGTLLNSAGELPESALKAVKQAQANGHLCWVNTGRPFSHVVPSVRAAGFDGFICSCGQHIVRGEESVFRVVTPPDICRKMAELVRDCGLDGFFESEEEVRLLPSPDPDPAIAETEEHFRLLGFPAKHGIDVPDLRFDKFCVWERSCSDLPRFLREAEKYFTVIDREGNLFEMVRLGCSKELGLRAVCDQEGIPAEKCIALGDSTNDFPMLRAVGHPVAMGNAPAEVAALCEYLTSSSDADGIEQALRHYGII